MFLGRIMRGIDGSASERKKKKGIVSDRKRCSGCVYENIK